MQRTSMIALATVAAALSGPLFAQGSFPAHGQSVTLNFTGQAEDYLIPTTDVPRLIKIALRGGSGGNATATRWPGTLLGGRGARVESIFSVGTGSNDLQPGGLLRFLVGERGTDNSATRNAGGGGGGGSGVLYRDPGSPVFVPLLIAGGGGGAVANQSSSDPGHDGGFGPCGQQCGGTGGSGSSGAGGGGLNGHGTVTSAGSARRGGRQGSPAGGAGGTHAGADGGWGCGGGGSGNNGGGGGGGFFGGFGGSRTGEGGGGGSFIDPQYSRAPRVDRYDSGRGDGYAIFTPLLNSGESIDDAFEIPDPVSGVGSVVLQGNTTDNIPTMPSSWTPNCMPGVTPSADQWYRFTNTAGCERELLIRNVSFSPMQLTTGAEPGSFANATCVNMPVGMVVPVYAAANSSVYLRVSSDPSRAPFPQTAIYYLDVQIGVRNGVQVPTITTQPQDIEIEIGTQANPAVMTVVAQNASSFQWLKRNPQGAFEEVAGQTSASLTLPFADCADIGAYKCRVMSACFGVIESDVALLLVGPLGQATSVGSGCAAERRAFTGTFYEDFRRNGSSVGFDLSIRSLRFAPEGENWRMSDDAGGFDGRYRNNLGLGDDQLSRNHALGFGFPLPGGGATTAIDVDSNGWIGLVSGAHAGSQYLGTNTSFLQGPARIAACWQDLNPAAGGDVYFDALVDRALITWVDVPVFNSTQRSTFQVQLFPNGEFVLFYPGIVGARVPLVGFSAGGVSGDPGVVDLDAQQSGPRLRGSVFAPTLGEVYDLRITAEGPTAGGVLLLGFAPLAVNLSLIGLPGCVLRTSAEASYPLPMFSAGMSTISLEIPAEPSLVRLALFAQAVVNEPGANPLGLVVSNGLQLTVGGCSY